MGCLNIRWYISAALEVVGVPLHVLDAEALPQHILPRGLDELLLNQVTLIHLLSLSDPQRYLLC